MYTIRELLAHLKYSNSTISHRDARIVDLAYDTRKIINAEASLFFALVNQRDGHQYIEEAFAKGVRSFVVSSENIDLSRFPNSNFIWVENTLDAMQEIATFHRAHFSYPVIGITGSNGKTIVKEWLFQLLSPEHNCFQSPKSYNSQLGVALSLWKLNTNFDIAIIEAGISRPDEMRKLAQMIQPTIGIFTSLGTAHREGFISQEQKFKEKWELFTQASVVIAPQNIVQERKLEGKSILFWGNSAESYLKVKLINIRFKETYVSFEHAGLSYELIVPFVDQAAIDNVLTCVTVMLYLGYEYDVIAQRITELKPLEMRLKLKRGKNNSSIIDDSYSNDLASLQIALDFLKQQNQFTQKKIILSDIESEEWTSSFENKLLELLNSAQLAEVFFVGTRWNTLLSKVPNSHSYATTELLCENLTNIDLHNTTILIKGARKYKFEKIISALVEQSHETVLEINLNAIEHNIQEYRSKIKPGVKVMAMVKAFSYGSGSFEVANILQFSKIDYLTVAFVDEGVALRKAGITLPIMVLSPHESTFEDLLTYQLEPEIYSLRIFNHFTDFLKNQSIEEYPIHIKLDTGMHRLGFMPDEVDGLLTKLKNNSHVKIVSVFSHLVGAGDSNLLNFTKDQINLFLNCSESIQRQLGYPILRHICNTSGIVHHPEAHLDMVRLGIGLYGFDMAPKDINLEVVSQLKTTITQIKKLSKTETVGYDRKGVLYRDSVIATVKIGYADGYDRRLGNGVGKMLFLVKHRAYSLPR